jgi:shikimate kinase
MKNGAALKGTSIYLVGMMGVGKSTVGKYLARALRYGFCDTDTIVAGVAKQEIAEIFGQKGEAVFREWEHRVLVEISAFPRLVVATGGGIVLRSDNWGYLRDGLVIWLDLDPEAILARLQADPDQISKRPLLSDPDPLAKLDQLYHNRLEYYQQADVQISAEGTPQMVVDRLLDILPTILKCPPSPNNSELN